MENKTGKYFKYAIGEIILVMVGILLALQVSNWNQQRVAKQKEVILLEALHNEFTKNQSQMEKVISKHNHVLEVTQNIISQFPIDHETINLDALSEILHVKGWGAWITFNPSQGVIRSLVNTSSFELISDQELRTLLISWEDVLVDYQEEENLALYTCQNHLYPEYEKYFSWKSGLIDNRIDKSFLSSYEFENIFYRRESNLKNIVGRENEDSELKIIKSTIARIIELSKPKK